MVLCQVFVFLQLTKGNYTITSKPQELLFRTAIQQPNHLLRLRYHATLGPQTGTANQPGKQNKRMVCNEAITNADIYTKPSHQSNVFHK